MALMRVRIHLHARHRLSPSVQSLATTQLPRIPIEVHALISMHLVQQSRPTGLAAVLLPTPSLAPQWRLRMLQVLQPVLLRPLQESATLKLLPSSVQMLSLRQFLFQRLLNRSLLPLLPLLLKQQCLPLQQQLSLLHQQQLLLQLHLQPQLLRPPQQWSRQ